MKMLKIFFLHQIRICLFCHFCHFLTKRQSGIKVKTGKNIKFATAVNTLIYKQKESIEIKLY